MFDDFLENYQKEWIENPQFEDKDRIHNWRNYVLEIFKQKWNELQIETRQAIILMAIHEADDEEWD